MMQGVQGDAIPGGVGGGGEQVAKEVMRFIGDADPIDGAEHNGITGTAEDDAAAAQAEFAGTDHWIVGEGRSGYGGGV